MYKRQGLHLFTTEVVQQGQQGQINNKVKVTYENGKIVKKELLSSEVVTEKTDTIIAHGTVQPGAYFTGKLTTYGGDCAGEMELHHQGFLYHQQLVLKEVIVQS